MSKDCVMSILRYYHKNMVIIVSVSVIAWILTCLDSLKLLKGGLKLGFVLITIIAMIRYDYGNDYMNYYADFEEFVSLDFSDILLFSDLFKDVGWSLFCSSLSILGPYGFFILVAFISVFTSIVYYKFIVENVDRKQYWLAMFIYLFTFDMFVLQLSMIRQGLAIALLILAYRYIGKGKLLFSLLLGLIAISFHKTSIIFLPFLLLGRVQYEKIGKWISFVLLAVFILFFASSSVIELIFGDVMSLEIFSIYEESYGMEEGNQMGIRRYFEFIPFFIALFYLGQKSNVAKGNYYLVLLSTISTLLFPFTTIIHLISRLCYYFNAFSIAAIPVTYYNIKNQCVRYTFLFIYMGITLYIYYVRFDDSVYTEPFAHYKTIFSVLF